MQTVSNSGHYRHSTLKSAAGPGVQYCPPPASTGGGSVADWHRGCVKPDTFPCTTNGASSTASDLNEIAQARLNSGVKDTPTSAGNMITHQFPSMNTPRSGGYAMAQESYPHRPGIKNATGIILPTMNGASLPQPIVPAAVGSCRPSLLRPMAPSCPVSQPDRPSSLSNGSLTIPSPISHDYKQPTHFVGSPDHRRNLPSVRRRGKGPWASSEAVKMSKSAIRNASGEFPCPKCGKVYRKRKYLSRLFFARVYMSGFT